MTEYSIGGCLRNESGKILISFSKFAGFINPTTAELFACHLFRKSPWYNCANLNLECDSKSAVDWLMQPYNTHAVLKGTSQLISRDHVG
ncbi:hypothetical protein GQ457_14G002810 [Hibiscus cannabinus]